MFVTGTKKLSFIHLVKDLEKVRKAPKRISFTNEERIFDQKLNRKENFKNTNGNASKSDFQIKSVEDLPSASVPEKSSIEHHLCFK